MINILNLTNSILYMSITFLQLPHQSSNRHHEAHLPSSTSDRIKIGNAPAFERFKVCASGDPLPEIAVQWKAACCQVLLLGHQIESHAHKRQAILPNKDKFSGKLLTFTRDSAASTEISNCASQYGILAQKLVNLGFERGSGGRDKGCRKSQQSLAKEIGHRRSQPNY